MERLTQLGTVTSSRVVVEKLVIDQEQLAAVVSRSVKTRLQPPRSAPASHRRHVACTRTCNHMVLVLCI